MGRFEKLHRFLALPSHQTQETVANINSYLDTQRLLRKTALQEARRTRQPGEKTRRLAKELNSRLHDLYLRREKPLERPLDGDSLLHREHQFNQTFDRLIPEIEKIREKRSTEKATKRDIIKTIFRTTTALPRLEKTQQEHVLGLGGLDRGEILSTVKKIAISAGIAAALTPVVDAILAGSVVVGTGLALLHMTNTILMPLVAASYAAQYGSLLLDAHQNIRLMKDKRYQLTPSIFATSGGHAARAVLPNNQKAQDITITAGTLAPSLLQEAVLIPLLATPIGPAIVAARNVAAALLINTPLIGVSELFLRKKQRKTENQTKSTIQ